MHHQAAHLESISRSRRTSSTVQTLCVVALLCMSCNPSTQHLQDQQRERQVTLEDKSREKRIDVLVDGQLFTSYQWPDHVYKPILYPIISPGGSTITRGFPLATRAGERNDHRHQVGNWLNYGNVNGYDFWGNGHKGQPSPNGGEIRHLSLVDQSTSPGAASLTVRASWVSPTGKELLAEKTHYEFIARDSVRIIDRATTLIATSDSVTFSDTKEGMFGLRVSRQLELPSRDEVILTDASGKARSEKDNNNTGVTGNYRSSEGISGEAVWGTRGRWMNLYGTIGNDRVSVVICDHPKNVSYPTWWHARGYGLFAANPLGAKDFTKGAQELNFALAPGDSVTFRYRIVVASGSHLTDQQINSLADEFAKKYY